MDTLFFNLAPAWKAYYVGAEVEITELRPAELQKASLIPPRYVVVISGQLIKHSSAPRSHWNAI